MNWTQYSLFKKNSWNSLSKTQILALSDAEVEELRLKQVQIDKENGEILIALRKDLLTIKELTAKLYGKASKEFRYVDKFRVNNSSTLNFKQAILETREKDKEEKLKIERDKQAEKADKEYLDAAIIFLLNKGKKIGQDFCSADAIYEAENLAFEEKIKEYQEGSGLFEFSGSDYCENCGGWDGKSHRCECGNRRVEWVKDYNFDFRKPYIYAEAY